MKNEEMGKFDIDLRAINGARPLLNKLEEIGGLPVVVIPLDPEHNPLGQGRAGTTHLEYLQALQWAYAMTPCRLVRIVPVMMEAPKDD